MPLSTRAGRSGISIDVGATPRIAGPLELVEEIQSQSTNPGTKLLGGFNGFRKVHPTP